MGLRKKKSLLDQASDTVSEYVEQVKPQLETAVATAREKAGPVLADARAKAAPVLADARDKAVPVLTDARDKARDKAGPAIAAGAAVAAEKIAAGAQVAADRAASGAQAAAGRVSEVATPPKKSHKLRKFLVFTGLAAAAAFVVTKLRSGQEADNWQSSYTPTPAPAPAAPAPTAQESGGASPDEAIADQAETPHEATTPDAPADVVEVDEKK